MNDEFILLMDDQQFNEFINIKTAERLEAEQEKIRIEKEKIEAENLRLQKVADDNAREAQRLVDMENARIEAKAEAERKAETDRLLAIQKAEQEKQKALEDERRKAQEEKDRLIANQAKREQDRIDEERRKSEAEAERLRIEKEEAEKLEKRKKYQNWLIKSGYTEKEKDQFFIRDTETKRILYKKVSEFLIN